MIFAKSFLQVHWFVIFLTFYLFRSTTSFGCIWKLLGEALLLMNALPQDIAKLKVPSILLGTYIWHLFIMISKCILYYFQNTIQQTLYQKCVTLLWCRATFVIFFTFLPLILHYRSNDNCRRRQRWQQEWKILWNQQVASSQTCIKSFD